MGGSTAFGDGTYIPDPLAQFLGRVVPWSTANPPDSYVNIHAFGGVGTVTYRGGGRAYASMGEYGFIQNFVGWLNRIEAEVFLCLSAQAQHGDTKNSNRKALRKRENARWLKALVLDLDVKPSGYPSQQAALAALLPFCDSLSVEPTIVSTGNGLHAYIELAKPISLTAWQPLADRLIVAADHAGLKFDRGVTKNPATLLRLPTSFNRKVKDNPKECRVLVFGSPSAEVAAVLSGFSLTPGVSSPPRAAVIDPAVLPPRPPIRGAEANRVQADIERARVVTSVDLLRTACPVVADSERRGGDGDLEPLWFELAKLCHYVENGRDYFHDLSMDDARYDPEQTDEKYDQAQPQGWPACATIARASGAALTLCQGCAFNGQGQSPINFATRGLSGSGAPKITHMNGHATAHLPTAPDGMLLPPGYVHTPDHYIEDADGMRVFMTRVHSMKYGMPPRGSEKRSAEIEFCVAVGVQDDDTSTFTVPASALKSEQSFADVCYDNGLMFQNYSKRVKPLMTAWITQVQEAMQTAAINRMGWVEADGKVKGFAFGGSNAPPDYKPIGKLDDWKKGAGSVIGKGCIEMEVLIAAAFAAPLMRMTGVDGGFIHVRGPSGRGKTASFEIGASTWSSIRSVLASGTPASTRDLVAVAHNLPVYHDEFVIDSKTDFNRFGELILNITTGKEHRRMTRNVTQRQRRFSQTLLITAGNFSLVHKTSRQTTAQAMRVLEIEISDAITKLGHTLDQVMVIKKLLDNNHGTAGLVYADYLDRNHANVEEAVVLYTRAFSQELKAHESERFWLATIVSIYVGATIAKTLGLLDFDIVSMKKFLFALVRLQRSHLADIAIDADDPMVVFNRAIAFFNQHAGNIIFTDTIPGPGNPGTKKILSPYDVRPPYVGRFAREDKVLLLSETEMQAWCQKQEHDYHQMRGGLVKAGYCRRSRNPRTLGGGTNLQLAAEHVLEFDLSKPENMRFLEEAGEVP